MKVKHKKQNLALNTTRLLIFSSRTFQRVCLILASVSLYYCLLRHAAATEGIHSGIRSNRNERLLELYDSHQKLCSVNDSLSGQGICIFVWDCHRTGGKHLGLCSIDSAIYGSCCSIMMPIGDEENVIPVDENKNKVSTTTTATPDSNITSTSSTTSVESTSSTIVGIVEETEPTPEYSEEDEQLGFELSPTHSQNSNNKNQTNHILVTDKEEEENKNSVFGSQNKCGVSLRSSPKKMRIIGGNDSHFAAWPWMVSVRRSSLFGYSSTHSCGGVLINENWVVTAAHCVFALSKSLIRVRFGDFDFKDENEELPFVESPIDKRIIHPDYNFTSYENDLALLKLQKPIEYSLHISPICLPFYNSDTFVGETGLIAGWGRLSEGGRYSQKLQQVEVPILSNTDCMNLFKESGRVENIPDNFICAGYPEGGKDGCQGDSGGPLQILNQTDDRWFLAGIMSWGVGCGEPKAPGVYTRINKFTEWILQQVDSTHQ